MTSGNTVPELYPHSFCFSVPQKEESDFLCVSPRRGNELPLEQANRKEDIFTL